MLIGKLSELINVFHLKYTKSQIHWIQSSRLEWIRTNVILGESEVEVRWEVPLSQEAGTYRIGHQGTHKTLLGDTPKFYSGYTNSFIVSILDQ